MDEMETPSSLALATPQGRRPPTDRQSRIRGGKLGGAGAVRWLSYAFFALALLFAAVAAALGDVFFFRLATESLIFGGLARSGGQRRGRTRPLALGPAGVFWLGGPRGQKMTRSV